MRWNIRKLRLGKEAYLAVQPIYYPGFTFAGIGEMLAVIGASVVAVLTLRTAAAFWPWWIAFAAMLLTRLTYWIVTHPVNKFWLRGTKLGSGGAGFFAFDFSRAAARTRTGPRCATAWNIRTSRARLFRRPACLPPSSPCRAERLEDFFRTGFRG